MKARELLDTFRLSAISSIAKIVYAVLLAGALAVLVWFGLQDKLAPASYSEAVQPVTGVTVQIGGTEPYAINLPAKLTGLPPRTAVTLTAQITAQAGHSLLIKSVFAPTEVYFDGALAYRFGQQGDYPSYMNDPPTFLTTVPLPDQDGPIALRVEYLSPSQRSSLTLPTLGVGPEAAHLAALFRELGFSLLYGLILVCTGLAMILVSLTVVRGVPPGVSFLWLGLFALSAGVWVLGECDLTAFLLPYPSLLYAMSYLGMYLITIPFLYFGLVILRPATRWPLYLMLAVHYVSVAAAVILQFTGQVDLIKSVYWFQIIDPLGFAVFAGCLVSEHLRQRNPVARRFAPAAIIMAAATLLELFNYWFRLTDVLTLFFQLGVLAFAVAMGVVSAHYVQDALLSATRLEYEMAAAARQLELQRLQYQRMAENQAAVKVQRHDLRHQLAVLRELNDRGKQTKLADYLTELLGSIPSDKDLQLCENYAVNAVAVHYADLARREGIEFSIQCAIPPTIRGVSESDLCIIVGNLLENAVEACRRMTTGRRFIRFRSRLQYDTLTITVDNSLATARTKGSVFLSSKRDGQGMGLASVTAVAQKNGGTARFEVEEGVFMSSVYVRLGQA